MIQKDKERLLKDSTKKSSNLLSSSTSVTRKLLPFRMYRDYRRRKALRILLNEKKYLVIEDFVQGAKLAKLEEEDQKVSQKLLKIWRSYICKPDTIRTRFKSIIEKKVVDTDQKLFEVQHNERKLFDLFYSKDVCDNLTKFKSEVKDKLSEISFNEDYILAFWNKITFLRRKYCESFSEEEFLKIDPDNANLVKRFQLGVLTFNEIETIYYEIEGGDLQSFNDKIDEMTKKEPCIYFNEEMKKILYDKYFPRAEIRKIGSDYKFDDMETFIKNAKEEITKATKVQLSNFRLEKIFMKMENRRKSNFMKEQFQNKTKQRLLGTKKRNGHTKKTIFEKHNI